MVWIDIVCLVCYLLFMVVGLWKGFLKGLFRLVAWICGLLGAYFGQKYCSGFLVENLSMSIFTVKIICIVTGFLLPFILCSIIGHFVDKAVSNSGLSIANRILGAALGAIKATIACFLFLTVLHFLPASGSFYETRSNAIGYSAYRWSLGVMGFSTEEVNIVEIASQKAEEISQKAFDEMKNKVETEVDSTIKAKIGEKVEKPKKVENPAAE